MGQRGWHGTLAPGIYRTARDRFRNTGTYNSQSGHLSSPHPAHPQEFDRMVSHQPVGPERHPLYPSPSRSRPPPAGKRMPASKTPSSPSWTISSPHRDSRPPPSPSPSGMPLSAPLPERLLGCAQGIVGPVACNSGRHALLPGQGLIPSPAGPGTGPAATPAPKVRGHMKGNKPKERRATRAGGGGQRLPSGEEGCVQECFRPRKMRTERGEGERKR